MWEMGLILFLDESGDHSLSKIDPRHPVFVLCGVIMEKIITTERQPTR
jgi:hypothetical protein